MYFNGIKKYFVVLDENKKEVKNEIKSLDDIYNHADALFQVIERHNKATKKIIQN